MILGKKTILALMACNLYLLNACSDDSSDNNNTPAPTAPLAPTNPQTPGEGDTPAPLSLEVQLVRSIQRGSLEDMQRIYSDNAPLMDSMNTFVTEVPSENGLTPLMIAAKWGRFEIAQTLIEMGADRDITDANGLPAAYHAKVNGFNLLARFLEQNLEGVDLNQELYDAARRGQNEDIRFFLAVGADINFAGNSGNVLMAAVVSQRPEAVKLLIDRGVEVNAKVSVRGRELNALEYARLVGNVNPEIIKLLEESTTGS